MKRGGEIAAVRALLEKVEVAGRVLTVDALHTTRETARVIVETHGADYLMTVKENAPETHELLSTIDWKRDATGFFQEEIDLAHGRIEQRSIQVMTPLEGLLNYPHVAQIFRLTRRAPTPGKTAPDKPAASRSMASPRSPPIGRPPSNSWPGTAVTGRSKSITTSGTPSLPKTPVWPATDSHRQTMRPAPTSRLRSSFTKLHLTASPPPLATSRSNARTPSTPCSLPERHPRSPHRATVRSPSPVDRPSPPESSFRHLREPDRPPRDSSRPAFRARTVPRFEPPFESSHRRDQDIAP